MTKLTRDEINTLYDYCFNEYIAKEYNKKTGLYLTSADNMREYFNITQEYSELFKTVQLNFEIKDKYKDVTLEYAHLNNKLPLTTIEDSVLRNENFYRTVECLIADYKSDFNDYQLVHPINFNLSIINGAQNKTYFVKDYYVPVGRTIGAVSLIPILGLKESIKPYISSIVHHPVTFKKFEKEIQLVKEKKNWLSFLFKSNEEFSLMNHIDLTEEEYIEVEQLKLKYLSAWFELKDMIESFEISLTETRLKEIIVENRKNKFSTVITGTT